MLGQGCFKTSVRVTAGDVHSSTRESNVTKPIDIANRWEPMVDDLLVETLSDAQFQLQRPQRADVAFACETAWEDTCAFPLSVIQEGTRARLFYRASFPDPTNEDGQAIAVAESSDGGITFARPDLGLVSFRGSTANNILAIGTPPTIPPAAFLDTNPDCPPSARYKGFNSCWQKLYAMASADGTHWRPLQNEPLAMEGTFDSVNTAFWDSHTGCYRAFTRYFENFAHVAAEEDVLGREVTVVRAIQSSTSDDFVHWTPVVHHRYDDDYGDMQFYTNATIACPGAEHIYLSFPNRYVQDRLPDPDHKTPGTNDAVFMSSRDGVTWKRYPEAWVRAGLDPLNWTDRNNYPVWGLVRTSETEWSMYVSEHYRHAHVLPRVRRLPIRPMGFVSVSAGFRGGELVTRPLLFSGHERRLNFSTSAIGSVQVGLLDAAGRSLPGLSVEDMEPMYGDALARPVRWAGGGDLSRVAGDPVRLRFTLKDADVFAFRFA